MGSRLSRGLTYVEGRTMEGAGMKRSKGEVVVSGSVSPGCLERRPYLYRHRRDGLSPILWVYTDRS